MSMARRGPRAGPDRRLAARTLENFRNNKQIVWPSLQLTLHGLHSRHTGHTAIYQGKPTFS